MLKRHSLILYLIVFSVAACAAPRQNPGVTPAVSSTPSPSAVPATIVPFTATPEKVFVPKANDLIFIEFFSVTWVDCRAMDPIVHGIEKKYRGCIKLERVNYHKNSSWHELLFPIGSPEFALLTSSKEVIHRWFGVLEAEEFAEILDPLCSG